LIHTHTLPWDKCLSHQIWPAIEKGWKDNGKNVHFFWGLAGKNIAEINECEANGEEWWYVDVGYSDRIRLQGILNLVSMTMTPHILEYVKVIYTQFVCIVHHQTGGMYYKNKV
jgi:hypothetical protein